MSIPENINSFSIHLWLHLRAIKVPREDWAKWIGAVLRVSESRGAELLRGASPNDGELVYAERLLNTTRGDLVYSRPQPSRDDIVRDNIEQLLLESGLKGVELANKLGVSEASFSRWRQGKHLPTTAHILKLAKVAGIDEQVNLFEVPIALLGSPSSVPSKRRWLISRLENAEDDTIEEIFPAVNRMLRP